MTSSLPQPTVPSPSERPVRESVSSPTLLSGSRPTHGGNRHWAAQLAQCEPDAILDFSASINPWGPPQSVLEAMQDNFHRLTAYPDPGYGELRTALGNVHHLSPDWILPGNGAAELLTWIGRELATLATTYVLAPGFADYQRAIAAFDGSITPLLLDLDSLLKTAMNPPWSTQAVDAWDSCPGLANAIATNTTTTAGILINNPHNPTGALFSRDSLRRLLEQFALVVVDEAFMDFLPPQQQESVLDWVVDWPNLVVVRSLTKFYSLPGLRLGYVVAQPHYLQRWQRWRDPWPINTLAEVAAIAALNDQPFQQQTWNWLAPSREQLYRAIQAIQGLIPFPGAANFLLVRTDGSSTQIQRQLLQAEQILIRDCLSFAELGDRYFRIAVRRPTENQRLLNGLVTLTKSESDRVNPPDRPREK